MALASDPLVVGNPAEGRWRDRTHAVNCARLIRTESEQVPELGGFFFFLCQPAIPAARPRACWQKKFTTLSTCNVTLITPRGGREAADHVCFSSHRLSLSFPPPNRLFRARQNQTSAATKTSGEGSILSIPAAHEA